MTEMEYGDSALNSKLGTGSPSQNSPRQSVVALLRSSYAGHHASPLVLRWLRHA